MIPDLTAVSAGFLSPCSVSTERSVDCRQHVERGATQSDAVACHRTLVEIDAYETVASSHVART